MFYFREKISFLTSCLKTSRSAIVFCGILLEAVFLVIACLRIFIPQNFNYPITITFLLLLAASIYIFAAQKASKQTGAARLILVLAIVFNFSLLFVKPPTSNDLYSYIYQSRVLSQGHANPYIMPYADLPDDSLFADIYNKWASRTTPYGPLFVVLSYLITFTAGNKIWLLVFLFKFSAVIANLLCGWLIFKITKSESAALLYAWNPLVVFEFAANGHNDSVQLLFILAGIYFFTAAPTVRSSLRSWFFFILSFLVKLTSALFLPFIYLFLILREEKFKERLYSALKMGLLFLIISFLSFYPFWDQNFWHNYTSSMDWQSIVLVSPLIALLNFVISCLWPANYALAIIISRSVFIAAYLLILFFAAKINKNGRNRLFSLITAYALFLFTFITWFMPWYITILIALLVLPAKYGTYKRMDAYVIGWTLFGIVHYFLLR